MSARFAHLSSKSKGSHMRGNDSSVRAITTKAKSWLRLVTGLHRTHATQRQIAKHLPAQAVSRVAHQRLSRQAWFVRVALTGPWQVRAFLCVPVVLAYLGSS